MGDAQKELFQQSWGGGTGPGQRWEQNSRRPRAVSGLFEPWHMVRTQCISDLVNGCVEGNRGDRWLVV